MWPNLFYTQAHMSTGIALPDLQIGHGVDGLLYAGRLNS